MPRLTRPFRASLRAATLTALLAALPASLPAQTSDGFIGAYLAARSADQNADFKALVEYGTRALADRPDNAGIMEGLLIAYLGLGKLDQAVPIARRLTEISPDNELGQLILLGNEMENENWQGVEQRLSEEFSVGGLMDPLILAWAAIGEGKMSKALDIFDELAKDDMARQVSAFQKAQALAYVGDYEGAARILSGEEVDLQLNRAGVIAFAQILSQLERNQDAVDLIDEQLPNTGDEEIQTLRAELAAGKPIEFTAIATPKDGLSALFYNVGEVLASEANPSLVLIYARLAQHLNPDNVSATLLTASVFETMGNHELAVSTYDQIAPESRAWPQAMLGKAVAQRRSGDSAGAIETLKEVADRYPELAPIHVALGDEYRYEEDWEAATAAYDDAIALYEEDIVQHWAVYFSRGITNERQGNWEAGEADFLKALELQPDQPAVLNYLGYSYVERRENLDQALDMIRTAVEARPNEGYIVDSLAWVYYRLGRYQEAVEPMEKAVALMPVDPVVNDHLGDVYWAVGRTREAKFQWSRALSFVTEETDLDELKPDRIRRKLEVGLDKVLEEEGADPIQNEDQAAVQ